MSMLDRAEANELVEGHVVTTKLHIPTPRRGRLSRAALVAALREGRSRTSDPHRGSCWNR